MSTTHSTPDPDMVPYTVVGNQAGHMNEKALLPFTILVLHRSNRPERAELFERLHRLHAREVISVECVNPRYDIEACARSYPEFRFIVLATEPPSTGQAINLAMQEASSPLVLVMWSDAQILPISRSYLEEFTQGPELCVVPHMRSTSGDLLPTLRVPADFRKKLKVLGLVPSPTQRWSLFPFDYSGLYHRESFLQTTGFDPVIKEPYWQKMDFGFRAWLWGQKIIASSGLRLQLPDDPQPEDTSPGPGYGRFYAKNILPEFLADHGHLPLRRFLAYHRAQRLGLAASWKAFHELRNWVYTHRYRFRTEARSIVEFWDPEAEGRDKGAP